MLLGRDRTYWRHIHGSAPEPIASSTQKVWGYENNYGALAQFTVVDEYQCHPKPRDLTWEEAACFLISAATTYRQLQGWPPNTVQPGDPRANLGRERADWGRWPFS